MGQRLPEKRLGVARLADHLEPCVREQTCDPLAHENVVFADDDAYGVRHEATLLLAGFERERL
jgi:hypothetical protein